MRGKNEQQLDVFSYVSPEQRVPQDHLLRSLRAMTDEALRDLQPRFNKLYAKTGRPSIAPEKLLRALLLQALYSVRSERLLMEQLDYNLLFRWFVGLNMDDAIWMVALRTGAIHRQGVSKSVVYTFAGSELLPSGKLRRNFHYFIASFQLILNRVTHGTVGKYASILVPYPIHSRVVSNQRYIDSQLGVGKHKRRSDSRIVSVVGPATLFADESRPPMRVADRRKLRTG